MTDSLAEQLARHLEPTTPPGYRFDPSQRRLMGDQARVIVVVWHRQKGKDFTTAAKAVRSAIETGQTWYIVSLTQRQADATFAKCRDAVKKFQAFLGALGEAIEGEYVSEQYDKELKQGFTFLAREIRLPNGGRVVSLPGRDPDTLAGLTGNVIFTEFGLFPNGGYDHWRVVFPLTTRGFQCIVISTPRGKNTKFYELFVNDGGAYSVHFCDIHRSIAEDGFILRDNHGNPTTIEAFKKLYGDAAGFEREYECKFTGDASALITWAELERMAGLTAAPPFRYLRIEGPVTTWTVNLLSPLGLQSGDASLRGRQMGIGWDVARRSHLSVLWVNLLTTGKPSHLAALVVMNNVPFDVQRHVVSAFMDLSYAATGYGDATGLGMDSNETLHTRYGDRWTPFTFTGAAKREVASALKTAATDGTQTLPPLDGPHKFVATDLYAVQKDDTGASLVISESENPLMPESHCDIAFAGGLARLAGSRNTRRPLPPPLRHKPIGF
jgi:phage FluMu gp28-like protein